MSYEPSAYGGYQPPASHAPPADPYGHPPAAYSGYAPPAYSYPPPYAAPPATYQPGPGPGPMSGPGPAGSEEVRTVFVTGFPVDVKERELNNLLRFLPGYEASQMNYSKGSAQGFALFATGAFARGACDQLQHVRFDDQSSLRCEMARKNMYIREMEPNKRPRPSGPPGAGPGGYGAPGGSPGGGGGGPPGGYGRPPPMYSSSGGGGGGGGGPARDDNPPCNTLFVGNLADNVDENELRTMFSPAPGFRQLKLMRGPKATLGFIEFEDVSTAMAAHAAQQGATLSSSDRGPIRVQYSKNPFGRKRDGEGNRVMEPPPAGGPPPPYSSAAPYAVAPPGAEYGVPGNP
ncbi:Cell wall integrity protein scw1 [Tetrabaena socialis]|uniref:Cell wall integrity protein scw1 n=1 Tax=Tetrabaena socialis TaxID=47790 RepID=A0A2J7ZT63_9CHLO|nr:Cell wall integrity protein scw1 [Tetrabaena socialis]|eukprot:PNH03464.1 Cell wall integrity protein scw1 [Tetrabaena socialis]